MMCSLPCPCCEPGTVTLLCRWQQPGTSHQTIWRRWKLFGTVLKMIGIIPVIEIKLKIPQDLSDNGPVLLRHVHPHQHHHGHEVHPHDLREEQHQHIGTFRWRDPDEKFRHRQQQTPSKFIINQLFLKMFVIPCWTKTNDSNHDER